MRIASVAWIAALVVTLAPIVATLGNRAAPLDDVLGAMAGPRLVEGRLTSAPHTPLAVPVRGDVPRPAGPWPVLAAAGRAEERAGRWPTAPNLQALGIAALAAGDVDAGVQALEDAAIADPSNAAIHADLAAAYLARATRSGHAIDVPQAMEAADRALRLNPRSREAQFNRALALERLGLHREAARAWDAVVAAAVSDGAGSSGWTAEARARLAGTIGPVSEVPVSPAAAATASLAEWARAYLGGADAEVPHLEAAGRFPAALAATLRDALPPRRRALAAVVTQLGDADAALTDGDLATAARIVGAVPAGIASEDSPFGLWARRIRLSATFGSSAGRNLRAEAESLLAAARRHGFGDVEGDALHRLGGFDYVSGAYERALERFVAAARIRKAQDNLRGALASRHVSAEAYYRLGRTPEAWAVYLEGLSAGPSGDALLDQSRCTGPGQVAVSTGLAATAVALTRECSARAPADLPALQASAYYLAARALALHDAPGEHDEAVVMLDRARTAALQVPGPLQRRLLAEIAFVDLGIHAVSDPERALRAATEAQHGLLESNTRQRLLELKVLEARAHRARRDEASARAALLAGVAIVDEQQNLIAGRDFLPSFMDASWDVFSELVDLEAEGGHADAALRWLDRGFDVRGRWRRGAVPPSLAELSAQGPVVAYLSRPEALRIWVVNEGVVHQRQVAVPRAVLERHAGRLAHMLALDDAPDALAAAVAAVARDVWWPVAPLLDSRDGAPSRVALVLDPVLQRVPFAMLPWAAGTTEVVVDRTATVLCPSLSACAHAAGGTRRVPRTAALHAGQGGDGLAALPAARAEAERIGRRYAGAAVAVATESAMVEALAVHDLVHFSGHAVPDERYPGRSALLLATDQGDGVRVPLERLLAGAIRARLVVLSACRTSRAEARRGEGGTGIAGEFLRAGVHDVVAAQWDVRDDVASEVMDHVHEALAGGAAPWDAVRAGQQRLRRDPGRAARDWAGYVAYTSAPQS